MNPRELANYVLDAEPAAVVGGFVIDFNDQYAMAVHYLVCLEALEKIEAGIGNANQVASMVLEHIRG
jgi:hypothetical protein